MEDLYKILEVDENATQEMIKKSFRKLSLRYHPDRNPTASDKYKKISNAYEILSDPEKKRKYNLEKNSLFTNIDSDLINLFFNGNKVSSDTMNFSDFIRTGETIFSNATPIFKNIHQKLTKPTPITKECTITIQQSYIGTSIPVNINRWIIVNGIKQNENETIYIKIPQGVDNNETIIAPNKGHIISESLKGDVKVFIKVTNNTPFIREGINLIYQYPITLKDALCGFNFTIHHLSGKIYKLNNASGNLIHPNQEKIIPNLGMKRGHHIGNIIVRFNVKFPTKINQDTIIKLKEIL